MPRAVEPSKLIPMVLSVSGGFHRSPDAELSALADKGELHKKVVLKAQTERLLKDERSRALFDGFGAQWLRVNELDGQVFDPKTFPQMTPDLRTAMTEEARLFFQSIVREFSKLICC